jgi:DnaK suppressor protein
VPAKKPSAADLKKYRAMLEAEEARLAETAADRDADPENADAGAMRFEMQKELAVDRNARDLLAKVEDALGRISTKSYGVCEDCGKPIPKARLQAIPYANSCVQCASKRR